MNCEAVVINVIILFSGCKNTEVCEQFFWWPSRFSNVETHEQMVIPLYYVMIRMSSN